MLRRIKNSITNHPKISNLLWAIKGIWGDSREKSNERYFLKKTKNIIPEYIKNNDVKKINIGCQNHPFDGWLNVDIFVFDKVAYLNATKRFPINDDTFDYVFSEHMIEHITYDEADFMIKECYRIMKPGAKIRIVTPGLDKLISYYKETPNDVFKIYTKDLVQPTFKTPVTVHIDYVINYLTYNYFHKFIHSTHTLTQLLSTNGFKQIKSCEMNQSDDPNLRNIEIHAKYMGEGKYDFESIYIEAEK